jgi:hypothetical protein
MPFRLRDQDPPVLAVTGIFAVIVGLADTFLLLSLGIPLAVLWGLLAVACNFIPYVGFIIGIIPPALLALLGGGWRLMIIVIGAHIVLNSRFTTLLPPYFVGDGGWDVDHRHPHLCGVLGLGARPAWRGASHPAYLAHEVVFIDADPRAAWAATLIGSTRSEDGRSLGRIHMTKDIPLDDA